MGAEDLHAEVVRALQDGQSDLRVVDVEAQPVRPPRGVDLERRDVPAGDLRATCRRAGPAARPKFGEITSCRTTREAPPWASCATISCVPTASTNGIGALEAPEFGTSVSSATVVSLAMNMSWT